MTLLLVYQCFQSVKRGPMGPRQSQKRAELRADCFVELYIFSRTVSVLIYFKYSMNNGISSKFKISCVNCNN